ncbi:MAG: Gfo/Idh/MocA family oxidoreductase [Cellvibrio sp.]|nr:Gfo/Idh/MocA family oxidoreductase [Cellvibrio sp.]
MKNILSTQKAMSEIDVAVVGVGRMGVRHIQAIKNLRMNLIAVADISPASLNSASSNFDVKTENCFLDAEEMLRSTKPNALVISTTAPSHAKLVCLAAELGVKYILCEKPMACSLEEVDLMQAACKKAGALLAINHQMRFMPHYRRVKELVSSEEFGPLSSVIVAGSNFGLAMNASHYFEMFRYITDSYISKLRAWFETVELENPRGAEFKDCSGRVLAQNDIGVSLYIDFSASAGHGLQLILFVAMGKYQLTRLPVIFVFLFVKRSIEMCQLLDMGCPLMFTI